MRNLNLFEVRNVSGGEMTCTAGTSGVNCTGTASDWKNVYDSAVDWVSRNVFSALLNPASK
ncbi:MAG: hypothetical protein ACYDCY_07585 [Metallibacterium sp.]